jgi:hypothetical protein
MGMKKIILIMVLWALSFIALEQLPTWISGNSTYNSIVYIVVNVLFAYGFVMFSGAK